MDEVRNVGHTAYMLLADSKFEVEFQSWAVPELERSGVDVVHARHIESSNVLDLVLRLPDETTVMKRRQVLDVLADFEHRFDYAVVTDAAFVWTDAD